MDDYYLVSVLESAGLTIGWIMGQRGKRMEAERPATNFCNILGLED